MVAVLADQGLPGATGQRAPGIGPDGRVVVVQTKLQLRQGDRLTYRRWDADFNNCASKGQLNGLLNNRAVPTVEAVQLSFQGQSPEQQLQTYNAALQRFQQENTALFFMIYPSIDMPNGQRCSAQVPGFGTGSLFGVSIAGHDPEDPERFRVAKQPKAKMLAHEASHEMPLTKEEAQEACFSGTWWEGNRKRVYELEKADNETGFAGVRAYAAVNSQGVAIKKRFHSKEATGAFFTPEEAALERAKSIAKKQKT